MKVILVFGGVYTAGILVTWAVAGRTTAVELAVDIGILVCLGLCMWLIAKTVPIEEGA